MDPGRGLTLQKFENFGFFLTIYIRILSILYLSVSSQQTFTSSKSTIEIIQMCVKYVQNQQ